MCRESKSSLITQSAEDFQGSIGRRSCDIRQGSMSFSARSDGRNLQLWLADGSSFRIGGNQLVLLSRLTIFLSWLNEAVQAHKCGRQSQNFQTPFLDLVYLLFYVRATCSCCWKNSSIRDREWFSVPQIWKPVVSRKYTETIMWLAEFFNPQESVNQFQNVHRPIEDSISPTALQPSNSLALLGEFLNCAILNPANRGANFLEQVHDEIFVAGFQVHRRGANPLE